MLRRGVERTIRAEAAAVRVVDALVVARVAEVAIATAGAAPRCEARRAITRAAAVGVDAAVSAGETRVRVERVAREGVLTTIADDTSLAVAVRRAGIVRADLHRDARRVGDTLASAVDAGCALLVVAAAADAPSIGCCSGPHADPGGRAAVHAEADTRCSLGSWGVTTLGPPSELVPPSEMVPPSETAVPWESQANGAQGTAKPTRRATGGRQKRTACIFALASLAH